MEKINARKLSLIFIFVLILLVLALLVGKFSYSYLGQKIGEDLEGQGEVTASGDTLIFTKGNKLSLNATTDNFKTGGSNLSNTTNPKVKLVASSRTNKANATYYVGVYIKSNSYTYSTDGKTPEVLLTIKDENGNIVTSGVDGLSYVTSGGVSGFDVTSKMGVFNIKTDYPISTTSSTNGTTHTWTFTLTFVNLSTDQSINENANMNIDVYIQKAPFLTTLADVCTNGANLANCITTLSQKSISGATNIYYHDSNLENGANDSSYRYAGPSEQVNNFVCFGSTESPCPTDNLYRIIGVIDDKVKLIKYDYMTTDELGTDGDYERTYNELGVMDSTYKGTYGDGERIGMYYWNYKANTTINNGYGSNTWSTSLLNKTNLNTNFINYLGTEWANKIATTTWKVGGNTWSNIRIAIPSVAYQNEITNPDATNTTDNATTYDAKIGLMYVSDYGFAARPSAWSLTMINYNNDVAINNNWMYMGLAEWTISRFSDDSYGAFVVNSVGDLDGGDVVIDIAVRASFNLVSSITYKSGMGSMSDPIIIN